MDRDQFEQIVTQYYDIYQYFTQLEITTALLDAGAKLAEIKVQNTRCRNKINSVMNDWDNADPAGRAQIEANLEASDGKILP